MSRPRKHELAPAPGPQATRHHSATLPRVRLRPDAPEAPAPSASREAMDALERARASTRTLAEISPDLVLLHRAGRVLYANPALVRALGAASDAEIVGAPLLDLLHADDRSLAMVRLVQPSAEAPGETVAIRWKRRDQGYRSTEVAAASLDFDGAPAVVIVGQDVTERAEFRHQLLQRDRMAALGTLSAGVAHEINNPLTYLLVNLEHVLRRLRALGASDDPVAELTADGAEGAAAGTLTSLVDALQQAVDGANRVRAIVRDLLTFSQGNVEQRGIADVRGIVESAVQMSWHEIRHRARLVKSFSEVPPIEANEARLGQVFLNLLINAAQAVPDGHADEHEIRVCTRTDERGNAVVEVSDTGSGIAAGDLPRIFDPFFTTKGEDGTGLGLAISHGTIRGLGGDIVVRSEVGRGTTFRVVLPPAKSWRGGPAPSASHESRAAERSKVLVVDDERLVGEAIARSLSDDSDVDVVTDARQAIERIVAGHTYDLVLCDLMMPVTTGMDLYAEVVRGAPKLAGRIVFMTGGAFTARARAFLESVVNPCLEKPIDMARLRSILSRAGR